MPCWHRASYKIRLVRYKKNLLIALILFIGFTPMAAQTLRGKASYYSKRATGAQSASGERIHHDSLTCAHRTYPFGTLLKVTNLSNGKEVVVRVTDRGPFRRGRIVDLSYTAAEALGMLSQGIAMVQVERIEDITMPYRPNNSGLLLPDIRYDVADLGSLVADDYSKNPKKVNTNVKAKVKSVKTKRVLLYKSRYGR